MHVTVAWRNLNSALFTHHILVEYKCYAGIDFAGLKLIHTSRKMSLDVINHYWFMFNGRGPSQYQSTLQFCNIHSFIHTLTYWWWGLQCKATTFLSGASRRSVSYSRILQNNHGEVRTKPATLPLLDSRSNHRDIPLHFWHVSNYFQNAKEVQNRTLSFPVH